MYKTVKAKFFADQVYSLSSEKNGTMQDYVVLHSTSFGTFAEAASTMEAVRRVIYTCPIIVEQVPDNLDDYLAAFEPLVEAASDPGVFGYSTPGPVDRYPGPAMEVTLKSEWGKSIPLCYYMSRSGNSLLFMSRWEPEHGKHGFFDFAFAYLREAIGDGGKGVHLDPESADAEVDGLAKRAGMVAVLADHCRQPAKIVVAA